MIKWLRNITLEDAPVVGGKAASLGELMSEGFNVPDGFVVTSEVDVIHDVEEAYYDLGNSVAVRSSSIAEDGKRYSFAGQYDTFLNCEGEDKVETAILNCFESINNPRAIEYRKCVVSRKIRCLY